MSISWIRYTLIYTLGNAAYSRQVHPVDDGFELAIDAEEYKRVMTNTGKFKFYNDPSRAYSDYDYIKDIEAYDPLKRVYLNVERNNGGVYEQVCLMHFSVADCEINDDRCTAEVTPRIEDKYSCVYDDAETEYNVLAEVAAAPPYIIINPNDLDLFVCTKDYIIPITTPPNGCSEPITYGINGTIIFNDAGLTGATKGLPHDPGTIGAISPTDFYDTHPYYDTSTILSGSCFYTPAFPYGGGWQPISAIYEKYRVISTKITINGVNPVTPATRFATVETTWGAETVITLNDPVTNAYNTPAGGGWIPFLDIFQGGQAAVVWGREPFYNDQNYAFAHVENLCTSHTYELINPYLNNSAYRADIYRGRLLTDAIQMFLDKAGCGLTLKSDFLQQNINPVTIDNNVVLTLNQCTDIKDPDSTEAASFMFLNFGDLLADLESMFDVRWFIEGDYFRIEHIRFFKNGYTYGSGNQQIIDLRNRILQQTGRPEIVRSNRYAYNKNKIYKSEIISPSQYLDYDFNKLTIKYDAEVIKDESNVSYPISIITDAAGVVSEPNSFNNDSIVMTAYRNQVINQLTGATANVVVNEIGYRTGKSATNGYLSVSNLFNRFYRDNRIKTQGTIENNQPETFLSQTDKILQSIIVQDCGMEIFTSNALIQTELGVGRVIAAKHRVVSGITELTIEI